MKVFKATRKVQVYGSSMAVTLPSLFVKACEIEKGNEMSVLYSLDGLLVVYNSPDPGSLKSGLLSILQKLDELPRKEPEPLPRTGDSG